MWRASSASFGRLEPRWRPPICNSRALSHSVQGDQRMAGAGAGSDVPDFPGARVLVVEARFYAHINDQLLAGARAVLARARAEVTHIVVPGALEIPPAVAMAQSTGHFDAYVALGCVIRGETTHYELVSGESCRGLMELGTRTGAAIGNGIL